MMYPKKNNFEKHLAEPPKKTLPSTNATLQGGRKKYYPKYYVKIELLGIYRET